MGLPSAIARALIVLLGFLASPAAAATVHVVPIEDAIGPATSDLVARSIERADEAGADMLVLRLDTPGGLDASMRVIVRAIVEAPLPVAVWVGPSGARAASAGTFILYAAHIAAMAPGTNLGAATPVAIGGGGDGEPTAMERKALEDAAAYLRSLAELRDRDPAFAEAAVREAKSLTYREALDAGVLDLVAASLPDLLAAADGMEVELRTGPHVVQSSDATIETVTPDWRYQLLAVITNPSVAAILMLIGVYGIIIEFYSPGLVGPGLIGAICLLLGLYAFQVLPVNYAGLALLLLGIGLVVAEAFMPSFGILGITGVVAFTAGAIMLMDSDVPGFGISPLLIASMALSLSAIFLVTLRLALKSRQQPVVSGAEAVLRAPGEVIDWHGREGRVRLEGEVWHARGPENLSPGTPVSVTSRDGLTLTVEPAQPRDRK